MKKYKLLKDDFVEIIHNHKKKRKYKLYRIQALRDFYRVEEDSLGGYIESEDNLSHEEDCWVYSGCVYGNSKITGSAKIKCKEIVNSQIGGNSDITSPSICIYDSRILNTHFKEQHRLILESKIIDCYSFFDLPKFNHLDLVYLYRKYWQEGKLIIK